MKKRYDDGYVLVYVVVVIVILSILVPAACANSLRNLKAQQASVERMQQLYEAEGQIERFVAEIENGAMNLKEEKERGNTSDAKKAIEKAFVGTKSTENTENTENSTDTVLDQAVSVSGITKENRNWSENDSLSWPCYKISAVSKTGNIQIETKLTVKLEADIKSWSEGEGESKVEYYSYNITSCTITYDSYDISASTETKNTGGEVSGQS